MVYFLTLIISPQRITYNFTIFIGCGELLPAIRMSKHATSICPYRYVPCPLKCGIRIRASVVSQHVEEECLRRVGVGQNQLKFHD